MNAINYRLKEGESKEYKKLTKQIKEKGMTISHVVPKFIIEKLKEAEKDNFEALKKYI